jgi:hypothetical protein
MTKIAFSTHWQEILHNYLLRRQNESFSWGTMDCCLFACDAVLEMTGIDLAVDFRGKYDSLITAVKAMKRFVADADEDVEEPNDGESDLVEAVAVTIALQHGIEEVPLLMAQRGDVVLLDSPLGKGLGILGLRGTHVHCTGPDGIVEVPLIECSRAWRIPKFAPVPVEATIQR